MNSRYLNQVGRMLQILPHVMGEKVFALKGGTAINFFIRDVPRLSVDIDLVYTPVQDRVTSLSEISAALLRIKGKILSHFGKVTITEKRISGDYCIKLFVNFESTRVIVEPNTILRGTLYPIKSRVMSPAIKELVDMDIFLEVNVLSSPDIYAGKICAALDRQHPRDLFDIKILFENEGITNEIRQAFVVYLASHDRPMVELLSPKLLEMQSVFENEFIGMTNMPVTYAELVDVRARLISEINTNITDAQRNFLISIKQGEPKWELLGIPGVERLPALQWKLANTRKMGMAKQSEMVSRLKKVLFT